MTISRRLARWAGAHLQALGASFLLVVFAAAVFWFFALFVPDRRQAAIDGWRRELSLRADHGRVLLERRIVDVREDLTFFAALPSVRGLLAPDLSGETVGAQAAHLQGILSDFRHHLHQGSVSTLDASGRVRVSDGGPGPGAAALAVAADVIRSGAPGVALVREPDGMTGLVHAVPVTGEKAGAGRLPVLGAVLAVGDASTLLFDLLGQPVAASSSESLLVREDGTDVLFLSPLRFRPDPPLSFRLPLATAGLAARASLSEREGFRAFVDYRGVKVFAAVRRLANAPWGLVVKVDEDEALADFRAGVRRTVLAWGSLAVAFLGITWGVWQMRGRRQAVTLGESEARYRTLLEKIPQGIFMKSRTFRYVSVNENYARDLGIRPEEAVGKVDYDLFPKEHADKYRADDKRVMETAQTEDFEEQYMQGGREKWIHTIKTPVKDRDGEIIGVLGVFWDITERKRAEEALRESEAKLRGLTEELESRVETRTAELKTANRELEAFSYSVSHDLRAPLRAVDGFSRILLEDHAKQLDGEGKRLLDVVRTNTRQMGQLIDDLLSFSRVGRQEMARTAGDMKALAHAAFSDLLAADERVSFTLGPLPHADVDPSLMRQVWTNLISNALKFTRPKAERVIEIAGRAEPGRVVYSVKDNGVGFDMAYADKLFGVFQRLHSSHEFEGTGVGLALVQRIVHRHGGEVWADGKVGEGATFSFSLPRPGGPP